MNKLSSTSYNEQLETTLQASVVDSGRDGDKKSLIESLKSNIAAFVAFIASIILKPFQLIKGLFTAVKDKVPAEAKAVLKPKAAASAVAKASKVIVSSVDIAAKKYALEKLKEIDNGMITNGIGILVLIDHSLYVIAL